jgi:predicted CxxxxCH...CXXCH cytochrome family protein
MRDELSYDAAAQSCSVTLTGCHGGERPWEVPHPVDAAWLLPAGTAATSHVVASLTPAATECLNCHQTLAISPLCTACHTVTANDPIATAGTCVSCHDDPPSLGSTAGGDYPQRRGAHGEHDLLPGVTGNCVPCHTGAGSGTTQHLTNGVAEGAPADVVFPLPYGAKSGDAVRNPDGTCSDVRCHGGVLTPAWLGGSLDRTDQCEDCHKQGTAFQTPQYNSWWSGAHDKGAHLNAASFYALDTGNSRCRMCHDAAKLEPADTKHFSGLDTPAFETLPETTIRDDMDYRGGSCDPVTGGAAASLGLSCHGRDKNWFQPD